MDDDLVVMSDDEGSVSNAIFKEYDQDKKFSILNDNALKAKRMLPRDWSKDLFSSPVITYDTYHHINKDYVKNVLQKDLADIRAIVRSNENLNAEEKQRAFDTAFPRLLSLIQKMAIPFDEDVLTEYLMLHVKSKIQDPRRKKTSDNNDIGINELYNAMKEVIAEPGSSKNKSANIAFFINTVFQSDKTSQVKISKRKVAELKIPGYSTAKNLDELYSSFSSGSEIEQMAIAYNNIHPSSRELSITGPGGKLIYPIGENNFISDVVRWVNKNRDGIIQEMLSTPYANHSKILETANTLLREGNLGNYEFKLNVFSGMEDEKSKKGVDYFGVNSLEDVISKMFFTDNNMIILPTMADKKTYYAIELASRDGDTKDKFELPHDILICQKSDDLPEVRAKRFSNATLEVFIGYFMDELESLIKYYDKKNVAAVVKNKNVRKKNFHGKVKNGKMDFSGNGGKFRYFYGLNYKGLPGEDMNGLNLNQILEFEYNREELAEDPLYGDGTWRFREDDDQLDGFETVRRRLEDIKEYYFGEEGNGKLANDVLYDDINRMLMARVYEDMQEFSKPGENQLISYKYYKDASDPNAEGEWRFSNRAIPTQLISEYVDIFRKHGRDDMYFNPGTAYSISNRSEDLVLSVIGNYVAQSMISTIEVEKLLSGDPAFYKWTYAKTTSAKEVNGQIYEFKDLIDKDTDKIKRLGALLSPGSELRTDFSEEEYAKYPWLKGSKYINATVHDICASSIYADEIKNVFKMQLLADKLRKANVDKSIIDSIYNDEAAFKAQMSNLSKEEQDEIRSQADAQADPYVDGNITVSDAQVMIRPDMYRKIRMMLGQWSVDPIKIKYKNYSGETHETYYSDNEAFEILENDPEWMVDPEKAAKVSRLQLFPLKMTYFKNDPRQITQDYTIAHGLYNKMAIFPAFKYLMRSTTGRKIYDRMNRESDPLDMLTFESAVKVGLGADIYSPTGNKTTDLSKLDEQLERKSACVLDGDNENWSEDYENTLNVEVQDLRGIRMQLNTEAHTDEERTIGTQMFKIMFSNLYDDEEYSQNIEGKTPRTGKQIREDIMTCIKTLTTMGVHNIKKRFWNSDMSAVDKDKVEKYLQRIAENNGLSESVIDILNNGATVESLMQRTLFEYSVSSLVNSEVIDINTKGGSAVQQSVFGFVSYGSDKVRTEQPTKDAEGNPDFVTLNDGRELNWNEKDGTMEVMLSMNFFKSVVPKQYQTSYKSMRNWLVNHDIIKGFKHIRNEETKEITTVESKPKPFGVGYRIPTQGLSSTFAFVVADVLPEQSGDLIIVPREFTAQTGSDFDVDKLYLATMSYKNGELETVEGELLDSTQGAVTNRLLQDYIDVVTDIKNRANARASIDVVTNIIQGSTLPAIRGKNTQYRKSMYELTPYFQLRRKQEFSIGKSGIGPFALNITNLALTQYAHISMDFSDLPFKLGNLDEVVGEDGIRISDWLSAMVNAHVDVAKDPYVFDLNINQLTYKYTNLLLRAGKGESTFLFLAQPAIKRYAAKYNNSAGLYGKNLKNEPTDGKVRRPKAVKVPSGGGREISLLLDFIVQYESQWKERIDRMKEGTTKTEWLKRYKNITTEVDVEWNDVFNPQKAKQALKESGSMQGMEFQVMSLRAMLKLYSYAQELSDLVKMSRIDTKKFGNTLATQRDFLNEYRRFKYDVRLVKWINTDASEQEPLDKYFKSTFLESKLYSAIGLTKDMLSTQMVTASDTFNDLIYTVFGEIFGFVEITDDSQNKMNLYEHIFDKKVVQAVSDAAENVIRQKLLTFYGKPKEINPDYSYRQVEKDKDYTGEIDFTFGGYQEELQKELKRIYFGDKTSEEAYERNSLFTNMAAVIQILEHSSEEDRAGKFAGLVGDDGRVSNELLNYLRPQPANERFDIPIILLKKTSRNTSVHDKNRLISSFDFLLKNQNQTIRRLARDIAIYAYYSTYNTNKHNTFFDLVPPFYRKQYDDALAKGVEEQDGVGSLVMVNDEDRIDINPEAERMIDAICRNFYDNDNIVPLYEPQKGKDRIFTGKPGEYVGAGVRPASVKQNIPQMFMTSKTNKPYLKIQVDGNTFLYKKKGFLGLQNKEGEYTGIKWFAYVLTPKLGIHQKSFDQYELSNSYEDKSIFSQNELPEKFSIDSVIREIVKVKKTSQEKLNKIWPKYHKNQDVPTVEWERYGDLTVDKQQTIDEHNTIDEKMNKNNANVYAENPQEYIETNSDVIIDMSEPIEDQVAQLSENNQYSAEKDGVSLGIINVTESSDIDGLLLAIQSTNANVNDMMSDSEKLINRYNKSSFSFADNSIFVSSEKEEKPKINELIDDRELEGARKMDEILDKEVEVVQPEFISKDEVSDSQFRGVTQEMIDELNRRKAEAAARAAKINQESENSKEHENC